MPIDKALVRRLYSEGMKQADIARHLECSRASVSLILSSDTEEIKRLIAEYRRTMSNVAISLPSDLLEWSESHAKAKGITLATYIRLLLEKERGEE